MSRARVATLLAALALLPAIAAAAGSPAGIPAVSVTGAGGGQTYTLSLQVLALMTALTLLPAIVLMMTAFTRIIIVLGILRQAIGAGQTPPNQVLIGLALFLTLFVMSPTLTKINSLAIKPLRHNEISQTQALERAQE
ncbi:MAG TPA: flagellar biosynthetic protein FliP, partial [Burkholderiales bacterium]|nr:flagellar biosynthetic protein FliP [Burkholderiales bacterium]